MKNPIESIIAQASYDGHEASVRDAETRLGSGSNLHEQCYIYRLHGLVYTILDRPKVRDIVVRPALAGNLDTPALYRVTDIVRDVTFREGGGGGLRGTMCLLIPVEAPTAVSQLS